VSTLCSRVMLRTSASRFRLHSSVSSTGTRLSYLERRLQRERSLLSTLETIVPGNLSFSLAREILDYTLEKEVLLRK
jgi:hypothetical protein